MRCVWWPSNLLLLNFLWKVKYVNYKTTWRVSCVYGDDVVATKITQKVVYVNDIMKVYAYGKLPNNVWVFLHCTFSYRH